LIFALINNHLGTDLRFALAKAIYSAKESCLGGSGFCVTPAGFILACAASSCSCIVIGLSGNLDGAVSIFYSFFDCAANCSANVRVFSTFMLDS